MKKKHKDLVEGLMNTAEYQNIIRRYPVTVQQKSTPVLYELVEKSLADLDAGTLPEGTVISPELESKLRTIKTLNMHAEEEDALNEKNIAKREEWYDRQILKLIETKQIPKSNYIKLIKKYTKLDKLSDKINKLKATKK